MHTYATIHTPLLSVAYRENNQLGKANQPLFLVC